MKIILQQDLDLDSDFYYRHQFRIYQEPYFIWDKDTLETIITTCDVYRIEKEAVPQMLRDSAIFRADQEVE